MAVKRAHHVVIEEGFYMPLKQMGSWWETKVVGHLARGVQLRVG